MNFLSIVCFFCNLNYPAFFFLNNPPNCFILAERKKNVTFLDQLTQRCTWIFIPPKNTNNLEIEVLRQHIKNECGD